MRIDPNVVVSPTKLDTTKSRTAGGTDAPESKSGASVVSLSAAATAATDTKQASNADRLDKIRALIDRGDYAVDLDQLASRIVDDEVGRTRKPS